MAPGTTPRLLLLTDEAMDEHAAPGHPERPERRQAVAEGVVAAAEGDRMRLVREAPVPADEQDLARVHPEWHVSRLDEVCRSGGGWIGADTYLGPGSMAAARLAAGATLRAALAATGGEALVAFAVVRPPGHHAAEERPAGFCLVNNVAVAVAGLRAAGMADRIAVLDWDVHHGDGTQAIFDADPGVFYASTHQSPLYPGTGSAAERGRGAAAGTKHNVPLDPGSGDREFVASWFERLLPAAREFGPQAIVVSAGFDAHRDDPLAHLNVTEVGYRAVAEAIGRLARELGIRGVALTLEGGYDLPALRASARETVLGMRDGLLGGAAHEG